ncbi:phosphatase, partial [Streptomyces sp. SID2131]|nr:phosphatase [Streptomyces sp. SID2131]
SCADTPRAVVRALREEAPGGLPDDVLVLCLDWYGRDPAERRAVGGEESEGLPGPPAV